MKTNFLFILKTYWQYGKPFMILSILYVVIVAPVSTLATVLLTQHVTDAVASGYAFDQVMRIIIQFAIVLISTIILSNIYETYGEIARTKIKQKINLDIYKKAYETDYQHFDNPDFYNNYTWAINEFAQKAEEAANIFVNIFQSLAVAVTMFTLIIILGPWIVVMTVAMLVIATFIEMRRNKYYIKRQEEIVPKDRKLDYAHRVSYQREYSADIKSTTLRKFIVDMYNNSANEKVGVMKGFVRPVLSWLFVQNLMALVFNAGIMIYISFSIIVSGTIVGVGKFAGLTAANIQLYNALSGFFNLISQVNNIGMYVEHVMPFFNAQSVIETNASPDGQALKPASDGAFTLELKDVSFGYQNSNFALRNVNFRIKAGERVAIVGENGAGKSTLFKLLLRLYDVNEGQVLVNDAPINTYDIHSLRNKIGVAFQNPNLYALPLADNLKLYGSVEDDKIADIIMDIKMHGTLLKSNADIHTEVTKEFSQDGIIMSEGEAQKVAISRILTKDFGLLLLDEPSSSLDPIAEHELMQQIYASAHSTTSILIAHRLSTVRDADRIYVMDSGSIAEVGNHDELMAAKGKYYEMFTMQSENYLR